MFVASNFVLALARPQGGALDGLDERAAEAAVLEAGDARDGGAPR